MSNKYPSIDIENSDLRRLAYFSLMLFRNDTGHMQGTSSKRDLFGGYVERWFNKVAESVIFENLLVGKNYKAVCDYFIYPPAAKKDAPDILGLQSAGKTSAFVLYNNGEWVNVPGKPRIEVKVVRADQMLVSVREPQMIDDYYAFIESNLEGDYLTVLFDDESFNDEYFESLKMDQAFIKADDVMPMMEQVKVAKTKKVGTMRLIGIYTKEELLKHTVLCKQGVKPYYFGGAENKDPRGENCNEAMELDDQNRFVYVFDSNYVALPISIESPVGTKITLKKKNKGSLYLHSTKDIKIDGVKVTSGNVKITYKKFDRSSSWDENIVSKYILEACGDDSTKEVVRAFDDIYASELT